ncbi:unnamed protein product, partial [Pylaiella littoralis]
MADEGAQGTTEGDTNSTDSNRSPGATTTTHTSTTIRSAPCNMAYDSSSSTWIVVLVEVGVVARQPQSPGMRGFGTRNFGGGGQQEQRRPGGHGPPRHGAGANSVVSPGSQLPAYPEPRGGYDYSRYPHNLPRPTGNQPPIHHADPRKRRTTCGELGHMHPYCPSRPSAARPQAARAAQHFEPPPWTHSYGQANAAQAHGEYTVYRSYDYSSTYDDSYYGEDGHDDGEYQQPSFEQQPSSLLGHQQYAHSQQQQQPPPTQQQQQPPPPQHHHASPSSASSSAEPSASSPYNLHACMALPVSE